MIIQNQTTSASVPKEYMSVYGVDTQRFQDDGLIIKGDGFYIIPNSGNEFYLYITKQNATWDNSYSRFGWRYFGFTNMFTSFIGTANIVLTEDVEVLSHTPATFTQSILRPTYPNFHTKIKDEVTTENYNWSYVNMLFTVRLWIQNPNLTYSLTTPSYIKFDFPDNVSYSSCFAGNIEKGDSSKNSKSYTFFLDHTALKNELVAKGDSYTTINVYHLDGTEWS